MSDTPKDNSLELEETQQSLLENEEIKEQDTAQQEGESEREHHGHHHSHHHHGHHHHHGRHRSSHHASRSRKKRKFKRFFRKNKKRLLNIGICLLLVGALIFMAIRQDTLLKNQKGGYQVMTESSIRVETTLFTEEVPLVAEAVFGYLDPANTMSAVEIYNKYHDQLKDSLVATPLTFVYNVIGLPSNLQVKSGTLSLGENGDFSNPKTLSVNGPSGTIEVFNLKTGTRYEYRLTFTLNNGTTTGTFGEVTTKQSPRWMNIEGLKNVRDIGGWKAQGGKTIKQGLLYRGVEMDGATDDDFVASSNGRKQMLEELGIRFDMDLRASKGQGDVLGSGVTHKYYSIDDYSSVLQQDHNERIRRIFSDLANPSHYPVYMHCTYGRDRTGTICYLLEGLLGVSQEDAAKEYELTGLTDLEIDKDSFTKFQYAVDALSGATFQEKVENYLLSVGVTAAEIQSIKTILLG